MSLFAQLLKESTEEIDSITPSEEVVPVDDGTAAHEAGETPEEEAAEEKTGKEDEAEEGTIQKNLQDIITSILDAIEQESLASGESFEDDESVDVGLEILYKIASKLTDEDAQLAYDNLAEYFDMKVEEGEEEGAEEEGFEEPAPEEGDDKEFEEDKLKTESLKKKLRS